MSMAYLYGQLFNFGRNDWYRCVWISCLKPDRTWRLEFRDAGVLVGVFNSLSHKYGGVK
jgi:hypothetical protein